MTVFENVTIFLRLELEDQRVENGVPAAKPPF